MCQVRHAELRWFKDHSICLPALWCNSCMGKEGKKMDDNEKVEGKAEAVSEEHDVKLFKLPKRSERSAVSKLLKKLVDLVGTENADSVYKEFTMDIIRAEHESRYGGFDGVTPHAGRLSFPIVCGNRSLIIQRRSGGTVQIMFIDHSETTKHAFKGIHTLRYEQQFDELWDLMMTQYTNYIESLEEAEGRWLRD